MSNNNNNHHFSNTHNFMNKIAFLDSKMRHNTFSSEEIINLLPIQKGCILDVGAGSGYLTIPAAKQIDGTVFAMDIDSRMLGVIEAKAKIERLSNIKLIQGNIEDIPLPDNSVDVVFASLILHEMRSVPEVLKQIGRVLKTDGHLLCLEYEKDESIVEGPPMSIRIASTDMEQMLVGNGYQIEKHIFRESLYITIARKQEELTNE